MLTWLLAGLALYLLQIYLPTTLYLPAEGVQTHLGGRDVLPEPNKWVGRARRALANMQENLPIFLGLGLLAFVVDGANTGLATMGAMAFVIGRALYVPAYMLAIPWVRSGFYMVALGGTAVMAFALL